MKADLKRSAKMLTKDSCRRFAKRATYERINERRGELIHRDVYDHDLTEEETAELKALQKEVRRLVNVAFPFDKQTLISPKARG
jgi:hypothetical protein